MVSNHSWQARWYHDRAVPGKEVQPWSHGSYGPFNLKPDASIQPEIVFKPTPFNGTKGFYTINVYYVAPFPRNVPNASDTSDYWSGCFNLDVPEFYLKDLKTGMPCRWHCLEEVDVFDRYGRLHRGSNDDPSLGECTATSATPSYIPMPDEVQGEWE